MNKRAVGAAVVGFCLLLSFLLLSLPRSSQKGAQGQSGKGVEGDPLRLKSLDEMPGPSPDWIEKEFMGGNNDLHFLNFPSVQPYLEYAQEYGDLVHFKLSGRGDFVLVTNADYCKQIFETPVFQARTIDPYISSTYGVVAGLPTGEFFPALSNDNSAYWAFKRTFVNQYIQPTYPTYLPYFNERSRELVELLKEAGCGENSFSVSPYSIFRRWTFELLGEVIFGKDAFNNNQDLKEGFFTAISYWLDHFVYFEPFSFPYTNLISAYMARGLYKEMEPSHAFLEAALKYKKEHGFGSDWMSILATTEVNGTHLTDQDVMLICLDFMDGFVGPTPFLLDYGLYYLSKDGFVQEKVRLEQKRVLGNRTDLTAFDLHDMPYLQGTAMELLRIYPAGGGINVRIPKENVTFQGYDIPANTTFVINVYALQTSEQYWYEPHNIDPNRWHSDVWKNEYAFQTFGGGAKGCPGKDFVVMLTNVMFSHLIQSFDILEEEGNPTVLFELVAKTSETLTHPITVM